MSRPASSTFKLTVTDATAITVKVDAPPQSKPGTPALVLAHGANNDLDFPLLVHLATHLAENGQAVVVRFNFPYVERGVTSPDPRAVLEQTFARVFDHVVNELVTPGAPVFVGGKSLGGRTAAELVSRGQTGDGLAAAGLIVLGYPLHAPGREDRPNYEPLRHIDIPSLFFVGTRDPLCNTELLRPAIASLVCPGELYVVEGGDHSLHLPRSSGKEAEGSYPVIADEVAAFFGRTGR
jgi:predicted alpha/beta-hydrolase family hydrolase